MTAPSLPRRRAWGLALVATSTMAISYVDRQTLAVLAPMLMTELHIDHAMYGTLQAMFSASYLLAAPIAGRLIDRVGARRGLLVAVLAWSAVAAAHSFVTGLTMLFALRIALGLAEAPSFPGAAQIVHRALPPEDRPRGVGVLFTGSSFGAMVAPPLAGALAALFGWRAAFVGTAVVGLVWVPLWLVTAFRPAAREVLDFVEPPRVVQHASIAGNPYRPDVALERPARSGALATLFHPAVLRAVIVVLASAPVVAFVLLWSMVYLRERFHMGTVQLSAFLVIPPVLFDVGAVAFGDLASRRAVRRGHDGSPPRALFAMAMLCALAIALMAFTPTVLTTVLASGIAMIGGGALYALITSDMLMRVPPDAISAAGGMTAAAQSIAYIVANVLIGRSVQASHSYVHSLVVLAAWVVPGCLGWLLWSPPPAPRAHTAAA